MACAALASVACTVFSARIGVLWPAGPQGGDVVQAVEAAVAIYKSEVAPSWNATVTTPGDGTSVAKVERHLVLQ
ncbi:hypothetical protein DIPPA_17291 [Diplonema papillatum]|nr:hypothetical protein DIPPA_17291 [Diplonema papillatum]